MDAGGPMFDWFEEVGTESTDRESSVTDTTAADFLESEKPVVETASSAAFVKGETFLVPF